MGWKLVVSWGKHVLQRDRLVLVPRDLFDACSPGGDLGGEGHTDPVSGGMTGVAAPTADWCDWTAVLVQVVNPFPEKRELVRVPQSAESSTLIKVLVCTVVAVDPEKQQVMFFREPESQQTFDVTGLVRHMERAVRTVYCMSVVSKRPIPLARKGVQPVDLGDSYLLPIEVGSGSASSSQPPPGQQAQIVPLQRNSQAEAVLLRRVSESGAVLSAGPPSGQGLLQTSALSQAEMDTVGVLEAVGAVALQTDQSGHIIVAMNPAGIDWSVMYLAASPVQVGRIRLNLPLWGTPKYEWFLCLILDGWVSADEPLEPWVPGGQKIFRGRSREPASYFACLVHHEDLVSKGVQAIPHGRPDMFYRCLLTLPAERLPAFLAAGEGQNNAYFVGVLRDSGGNLEQIADDVPLPFAALPAPVQVPADPAYGEHQLVPMVLVPAGWSRCLVDDGEGTPAVKVYFDHFTGGRRSGGTQRGWVDCPLHGCIRYRPCHGSKERFVAEQRLWLVARDAYPDKAAHMGWAPPSADVDAAEARVRMTDF